MYLSEYYYAASKDYWTLPGYNSSEKAINENWLYTGLYEWIISRCSDASDAVFAVRAGGDLIINPVDYSDGAAVRPSFSLSSSIKFTSGEGTAENPIRIKL